MPGVGANGFDHQQADVNRQSGMPEPAGDQARENDLSRWVDRIVTHSRERNKPATLKNAYRELKSIISDSE
jgi:hypothetical protein